MKNPLKLLFLTLVIAVVMIAVYEFNQTKLTVQSDTITKQAPQLGPGAHLLLPNLDNAQVVAPDRPHDPIELQKEETRT